MQRVRETLALLVVAALVTVPLAARPAPEDSERAAEPRTIRIPFSVHRLDNGLRVILSEDHSAPTYSISVTYDVGSRDERPGRTGFAHLFEHMMFQGSENVGKGEHFILVLNNGGGMNGTTNADRTNYFQTLPANQLELGLFLEADRMRALDISQANLDNQRNAVQEERRQGVDNQPYGRTFETLLETAYDNFAYKHSTIGSMEDLNAATLEDVSEFFRIYYAPNNAVLVLVGAFDSKHALERIKHHFGSIPRQPAPPAVDMTEPPQTAERRASINDAFARLPRIDMAYKIPAGGTDDWYALSVLGTILGSGQSSRLFQTLVREKEAVVQAFAGAQERRGPSLFNVIAIPRPGKSLEEVEKLMTEEIEKLQNEPVADWELEKVRMQLRRQRAQQAYSSLGRAIQLGQAAVYYNDPDRVNTFEERINRVTAADVQRVAKKYLVPTNRTVVTTIPQAQAPARPAATE
jgi:zinc protease